VIFTLLAWLRAFTTPGDRSHVFVQSMHSLPAQNKQNTAQQQQRHLPPQPVSLPSATSFRSQAFNLVRARTISLAYSTSHQVTEFALATLAHPRQGSEPVSPSDSDSTSAATDSLTFDLTQSVEKLSCFFISTGQYPIQNRPQFSHT